MGLSVMAAALQKIAKATEGMKAEDRLEVLGMAYREAERQVEAEKPVAAATPP